MMSLPQISTARLWLRPLQDEDVEALHQLWIKPGLRKYLWDDEIVSREKVAAICRDSIASFQTEGLGLWAVFLHDHQNLIGFTGFWFFHDPPRLQLLYGIDQAHWDKGLASEAAQAMIRYGFEELSLERIEASTDAPNAASVRVMEKCGMSFLKRVNSGGLDTIYYEITRESFDLSV